MEIGLTELVSLIAGIGGALGIKQIWPLLKQRIKNIGEVQKIKAQAGVSSNKEVIELWKERYEEQKKENEKLEKVVDELRHEKELLIVKFTKMREKWLNSESLHSHGKKQK